MLTLMICLLLAKHEAPSSLVCASPDEAEAPAMIGLAVPACMQGPWSDAWIAAAPVTKTRDTCGVVRQLGETALFMKPNA